MDFIIKHLPEILTGWAILSIPASVLIGCVIRSGSSK